MAEKIMDDGATLEVPKPAVRVYDIPADATPEETARLIGKHDGYYLLAAIPWPGVGARVFLRQHAQNVKRDENESPEREREDAAAEAIIRKYPKLAAGKLADKLAEHGIVRGAIWVGFRRKTLERTALAESARRA